MEKPWGKDEFWGMNYIYDPQWILDEEQKGIEKKLMEVCRTVIRPNAVVADQTYEFPKKSMHALASLNLLSLIVPRELGGLGQNHVCVAMVVETIARYGCPSTAMIYVMHIGAVALLLFRYHECKTIRDLLCRLDKDKLIGTLIFSDPATGGHNWYPFSSKCKQYEDGRIQLLRYGSWATSAGFADFYLVEATSPGFGENFMNLSSFLLYKDEVRSSTEEWSAMGMHGNQSGPVICEAMLNTDRLVGEFGEFPLAAHEVIDPYFLVLSSACWNGVALGCIDIAKKHVTQKQHADMGMRVADYQIIQDYFGEAITETNASRMTLFGICRAMDDVTKNNDWAIYANKEMPCPGRGAFHHWCFQVKIKAASNVCCVGDKMLFACGGAGYKTDLGLERLLRDGKAGWTMGASNEVLRQLVGKIALFGMEAVDFWCKIPNDRILNTELRKLGGEAKRKLAERLLTEADTEENGAVNQSSYQDTDFDNPFNTALPDTAGPHTTPDGTEHRPALSPDSYTALKLESVRPMGERTAEYSFSLPDPTDHTGCLAGQYVKVRVNTNGPESRVRMNGPESRFSMNGPESRVSTNGPESRFSMNGPESRVRMNGPESRVSMNGPESRVNTNGPESRVSMNGPESRVSTNGPEFRVSTNGPEFRVSTNGPEFRVSTNGPESKTCERYFSPVSATSDYGKITVLMKYETAGVLSQCFRALKPGDLVEFKGPCGGFEYVPNSMKHLSLVASGIGCTPVVQLVREVARNPEDQTSVSVIYYADKEAEMAYWDELNSYSNQDDRIKLFCSVGEVDNEKWQGGVGYIDSAMLAAHLPPPKVDSHQVLVCGGPSMVINVLQSLSELGCPSQKVFVYGKLGAQQVRGIYGRYATLSSHSKKFKAEDPRQGST